VFIFEVEIEVEVEGLGEKGRFSSYFFNISKQEVSFICFHFMDIKNVSKFQVITLSQS